MGLALITTTPAEIAVADAFAAFYNAPSVNSFCALVATTRPLIAAVPAPPMVSPVVSNLSRSREILPGPWRPVTAPDAFNKDFEEIRVVTDKMLRLEKLREISRAVGYAFAETVFGDELYLTGLEQLPEIVGGRITGEGKSILTFDFSSTSSRRTEPDFVRAFEIADTRIIEGSPVRSTDRAGANTKGTKLVDGIGPDKCKVQFFVR